jgi:hypothetical protein
LHCLRDLAPGIVDPAQKSALMSGGAEELDRTDLDGI